MNFLNVITRVWKAKDLRKKVFITLLLLVLFRLIAHLPTPGIDASKIKTLFDSNQFLSLLDIFSGGSLARFSIAAMGVNPYINASIIMQLLTMIVPKLAEIQKDGERGRNKMNQITRYLAIPLAAIQAFGLVILFRSPQSGLGLTMTTFDVIQVVVSLTCGAILLMWLGELITNNGIGNGISLIIFTGIVTRLPSSINQLSVRLSDGQSLIPFLIFVAVSLLSVYVVVLVNEGSRKIPVTYAKRIRGNRIYGGANTHIPLKVNTAGVIPIIFALSILSFPTLVANFFVSAQSSFLRDSAAFITKVFDPKSFMYYGIYFVLVIGFTYFYTLIAFNPSDVADNLKKQGGFIPGIRPGDATVAYLTRILNRITVAGAVFLGVIAVMPFLVEEATRIPTIIGGTSLLIVVSVILETMRQMETQLMMREYDQFMER